MARISRTAAKPLPPLASLQRRLAYDPETGVITETRVAGTYRPDKNGYGSVVIGFEGQLYKAHRLAWKIYYGTEPPPVIDHINGDPKDNRISNLRAACFSTNAQNARVRKHNTSSVTGVKIHKQSGKFIAQIDVRGERIHLGLFPTIAEAAVVRRAAEIKHHGEFAGSAREA